MVHGNAHAAAAAANGDATMADAPAEGDGDGAALAKALAAVTGGARDGNAPPATDTDDSNATVPCAGHSTASSGQ
jgi:hypothetical protein